MSIRLCIGDIRRVSQEYWEQNHSSLTFQKALGLALQSHAASYPQDWPDIPLDDAAFQRYIDSIPLNDFIWDNRTQMNSLYNPASKKKKDWAGSFYNEESSLFRDDEDILVHTHIPNIDDGIHTHDFFEVNYVYYGEALLQFGNIEQQYPSGTLCIFPPNSPHNFRAMQGAIVIALIVRKTTFDHVFSLLLKQPGILSIFFQYAIYNQRELNYFLCKTDNPNNLKGIIQSIMGEAKKRDSYTGMNCASLFMQFMSTVLRNYQENCVVYDLTNDFDEINKFMAVLQYIKQNLRTVSLPVLSEAFYYSKGYLGRKIREMTGKTFGQYLIDLRLQQAATLLKTTKLPMQSICEQIGYDSVDYFTKAFKRKYGLTPQQYRLS